MSRHIRSLPDVAPKILWLWLAMSLFTTSPAYPWGSKGHEIVAAIAETYRAL
jgi:hypothetical protein